MADAKKFLDYAGLQIYNTQIKNWATGKINDLDVSEFAIAEKNSTTNVITIHGAKEADGKIAVGNTVANDVTLAAVAATGAAADVTYSNTIGSTTVTNVDDALDALASAAGGGIASKTVYITETAGQSSDAFSKRYGVYQGATGSTSSPVVGEKLVDIDIPKDMVVESGSVVDVVFKASDDTLHEGSESGTDVTEDIKGVGGTATAADAGKYIKLVIANASSSKIYIKVSDLVDIYTGGTTTEIAVSISNSNVITATIVDVDADKVTYKAATTEPAAARESVKGALTRLDSAATVSQTGTGTDGTGLTLSVSQSAGVLSAVSGEINTISTEDINALFPTS